MNHKIIRLWAVLALTDLSRSTVYNKIANGTFPAPVSLGPRAIGFYESEIHEWLANRPRRARSSHPQTEVVADKHS
jgi:prophage regulatory protein